MAEPDDGVFRLPESISGILNPILSFATGEGGNLTLEQLKRRRAVAAALASQKRGFPKNIGEGIASLGSDIGEMLSERRLSAQEAAYDKGVAGTRAGGGLPGQPAPGPVPAVGARPPVGPVVPPGVTPPVPGPAAARPSPAPPAPVGPMGAVNPATWEPPPGAPGSRDSIARGLAAQQQPPAVAEGGLPPNPTLAGPQAPTTDMPVPPISDLGGPSGNPLDAGASFAENDATPTDIQPMPPRVRVAGPAVPADVPTVPGGASGAPGGIPGPLTPPAPSPPPPTFGQPTVPPQHVAPREKPVLPAPAGITEYELRGHRMLKGPYGSDPRVQQDAKALIEYGQAERAATNKRNEEIFKGDLGVWEKDYLAWQEFERNKPKTLREQQDADRKAQRTQMMQERFGSLGVEHFAKQIDESQKSVANLPASTSAIAAARNLLDGDVKMFTGSDAEIRLSMAKLGAAIGRPTDPRIPATEQFKSVITPIMAQLRAAVVGTGAQSEKELKTLEQAVGSDIKLDAASMRGIIKQIERINEMTAIAHQKRLQTFAGNDENDKRMVYNFYGLPMEKIVAQDKVNLLLRDQSDPAAHKEFDDYYHTPGLAQRVLATRRGR